MTPLSQDLSILRHDMRLGTRGLVDFLTGARTARQGGTERRLALWVVAIVIGVHALLILAAPKIGDIAWTTPGTDVWLSTKLAVVFCILFAAALDASTYALYARGDYDLLFSAPVPPKRIFAVRLAAIAGSTAMKMGIYGMPFINAMAIVHGPQWLMAYLVLFALVLVATTMAVLTCLALVFTIGLKRTRIAAQLAAAFAGLSVLLVVKPEGAETAAPGLIDWAGMVQWLFALPSQAFLGQPMAAVGVAAGAVAFLFAGAALAAGPFVESIVRAAGQSEAHAPAKAARPFSFVTRWPRVIVRKERRLILRDPWLMSHVMMQCLYLVPGALAVFFAIGRDETAAVMIPAVVTAFAGQIAGSITFVAISTEDAPELISVAPVESRTLFFARAAAILEVLALLIVPMALAALWYGPVIALLSLAGGAFAGFTMFAVNLWYQTASRKKDFMKRRKSSSIVVNVLEFVLIGVMASIVALLANAKIIAAGIMLVAMAMILWLLWRARPSAKAA
jgi:ABC-2 type transport system permease protein